MKDQISGIASLNTRPVILYLLIFFLTILSYSNTLHSPTVLDDRSAFLESSRLYLPDLSIESLAGLSKTRFGMSRFIPVLSFALNHYFSNGRLIDYHLTNISIHLLTFLFFSLFVKEILFIARKTGQIPNFKNFSASLFVILAAGMWALNPVQTNAITYLVQRMTALCAMFYVASLFFYIKGRLANKQSKRIIYYFLTGISSISAFMSKENSATLPLAIIMIETLFLSPGLITNLIKRIRPRYWVLLTFIIVLGLPLIEKPLGAIFFNGYDARAFTAPQRLLTEARVVIWYVSLLLYPAPSRMNLDHDFSLSHSLFDPWSTIVSIILIMALFSTAITQRKEHPLYTFGILWFLMNLVIESTIIPLEIIFEHRLYLPSMGLFIAVTYIFALLSNSFSEYLNKENKLLVVLSVILLSTLSILTTFRNNSWFNTFTIYEDCYKKSPNKPRNIANLGLAYAEMGDNETARKYFYETIEKGEMFSEEYISSANNILTSLIEDNKYTEAMKEGERLYKNIPTNVNAIGLPTLLYTLGIAYQKNDKPELAYESFREALRIRSDKRKDLYIYNAIYSISLEIAEQKSKINIPSSTPDTTKNIYALENLFNTAIESRDYDMARSALYLIQKDDQPRYNDLFDRLELINKKNIKSSLLSNVKNHDLYINDSNYRNNINILSFINNNYSPLKFIARRILDNMRRDYPDDPFVWEMYVGLNYNKFLSSKNIKESLTRITDKYSVFPNILSLAAKIYLVKGDSENALALINNLLNIYPAHPHWLYWEQMRTKLGNKK